MNISRAALREHLMSIFIILFEKNHWQIDSETGLNNPSEIMTDIYYYFRPAIECTCHNNINNNINNTTLFFQHYLRNT